MGLPVGPDSQLHFLARVSPVEPPDYLHFEPVAGSIVVADVAGGLGHIEEARAGVLDELVVEQLKTDLVTGLDVHVGLGSGAGGTLVAPQVVAISRSASILKLLLRRREN